MNIVDLEVGQIITWYPHRAHIDDLDNWEVKEIGDNVLLKHLESNATRIAPFDKLEGATMIRPTPPAPERKFKMGDIVRLPGGLAESPITATSSDGEYRTGICAREGCERWHTASELELVSHAEGSAVVPAATDEDLDGRLIFSDGSLVPTPAEKAAEKPERFRKILGNWADVQENLRLFDRGLPAQAKQETCLCFGPPQPDCPEHGSNVPEFAKEKP